MKRRYTTRIDSMHVTFQRSALSRDDDDYAYFAVVVAGQPIEIPNKVMGTNIHSGDSIQFGRAFELSADVDDSDSLAVICTITNLSDSDTLTEQAQASVQVGAKVSSFVAEFAEKFPGGQEAAVIAAGINTVLLAVGEILKWFDTAKCNGPVFNDTILLSSQQLISHTQNGQKRFKIEVPFTITSQHDCGHQPETLVTFSIFDALSVRQRLLPDDDGSQGIRHHGFADFSRDSSLRHAMGL